MSDHSIARRMWRLIEPVHAVTYFAEESAEEYRTAGLKGFWMGYFAGRSAAMGAVGPAVVTATFYNFAPKMAARALPDAWGFASPARVLEARLSGVDRLLDRILGAERASPEVVRAAELARRAAEGATVVGRPLAAAHAALAWPEEPALVLWQAATVLREHRGDGHVAALVDAGLDGCEAHISMVATGEVPRSVLQPARGWTDEEWDGAERSLAERGWVDAADPATFTPAGAAVRNRIEESTDRMAVQPWERIGEVATEELRGLLRPVARRIAQVGLIPMPNPIGLGGEARASGGSGGSGRAG